MLVTMVVENHVPAFVSMDQSVSEQMGSYVIMEGW